MGGVLTVKAGQHIDSSCGGLGLDGVVRLPIGALASSGALPGVIAAVGAGIDISNFWESSATMKKKYF